MLKIPKGQKQSVSHTRSKKQESELATRLGGKITPGSGNKLIKGDVRVNKVVRVECKTTKNKSFSVTQDMLDKIELAALPYNEMPVLQVEFIDAKRNPLRSVCIVPDYILEMIMGQ